MNKKIAKETTEALIGTLIAFFSVAVVAAGIFGILYLGNIHWLFYGLLPFYMWGVIYFYFNLMEDAETTQQEQ